MAAPKTSTQLTADEIDDILYLTRTNDTEELIPYLTQLSQHHGADSPVPVLEACVDEYSGNTAFHYAAANGSTDLLQSLLKLFPETSSSSLSSRKTQLNAKNLAGNTPIHWAALNGHSATVQLLATHGADVWVKNAAGNLPVFEAERAGKDDVVAVLLLAGGKEVEDQLAAREGRPSQDEVEEVESGEGSVVQGSSSADEAVERLEKTTLG